MAGESNRRSVASHVRERQRAVAEREAVRLARPEVRPATFGHANRRKSAVTSTPSGVVALVQPTRTEWCGPFSIARQMIAERDAKKKQEAEEEKAEPPSHPLDQAMDELEDQKKRKVHPSLQWKARSADPAAKRTKRATRIPSLFDLCVDYIVENFEYVDSLGNVDHSIRTVIMRELVAKDQMNAQSFQVLAEDGIEALEMIDCSQITQDILSGTLAKLLSTGLQYLVLDQCGRCVGTKTVDAIASSPSCLFALSIGGAYLLKDADAARLVASIAPTVSSLEFKACPLLSQRFCESVASHCSDGRLLELSLEDIPFEKEALLALAQSQSALCNLRSLSLRRIDSLDDDTVHLFLQATSKSLEQLDLSENHSLSDGTLASIREYSSHLSALHLSNLKQLTSEGLEALFTPVSGMPAPPMLRILDLGTCDARAVTDDVVRLAAQAAPKGGMHRLNAQGSLELTDDALECLAATSHLHELNVSFCPTITDQGIGYLVDACPSLNILYVWGCAQLTNVFFQGHSRVHDSSFEVHGIWKKKGTVS